MEEKVKRKPGRPRKNPLPNPPVATENDEVQRIAKTMSAFKMLYDRVQRAQRVPEFRIRNYTQEDLERYISDIVRYQLQLIDINQYAYTTLGLFRDLVDFYVKPMLYRWTLTTHIKPGFDPRTQDQHQFDADHIAYATRINQLNFDREMQRLLTKMFLEDAVFGYWVDDGDRKSLFYLPSTWCILRWRIQGNWTFKINTQRISEAEIEELPDELARLIRHYRQFAGEEAWAPVPFEKTLCLKYNDHTAAIFPPFTHVLLLIIDLMRAKRLALTQMEQDVINLIQMLIPSSNDRDNHILFTNDIIDHFASGLYDLVDDNNAILPTPFQLSVLNTSRNNNVDSRIITDAMESYHNETGLPRFGGSNTAAEMKRALQFANSKVFVIFDQLSAVINLKMKLDGFTYDHYDFVYRILRMSEFNQTEFQDTLLKHAAAGRVNKMELEAAFGNNPAAFLGQYYTENVVYRNMLQNLLVPPSSHTQSSNNEGGRPLANEGDLTESGEQARADDTNNPDNRAG